MVEPPLNDGADHETVALVSPVTAATLVGAFGTVAGVVALLESEEVLVPTEFVAVTVKV